MDVEEEHAPPATPGRQIKTVDAGIIVNGVMHFVQSVLSATLHPAAVEKAIAAALKEEPCKTMMAAIKIKRKGPALSRSTYTMFVTIFTHAVKGGEGKGAGGVMAEAGLVWRGLPGPLKAKLVERFDAVRQLYNAKITAGDAETTVAAELAAYEAAHGLEPFDYPAMLAYKAAGEAATPGPKKGAAAATPGPKKGAAAATPGPATGKRPAGGDQGSSDDDDDDNQTPAAAAAAAGGAATAEKKHKKHKKEDKKEKKKKKKDKAAAE